MKKTKILILVLIVFNIVLASRWVIDENLFFHTDIARDFLLMEDIVYNHHPALIGPRSGAIPGVFHGPLWLYLNLPAYIIGQGNPVTVGWFWLLLYIASLGIIYFATRKIFSERAALLSCLLLSVITVLYPRMLFNPYGALMLSPLYFYSLWSFLKNAKFIWLVGSLFVLGLIIQFQMAFGIPILILSTFLLIGFFIHLKKFNHIVAFLILLIPLSSYILFDLRNNFLQLHSIINYLSGTLHHGQLQINFAELIKLRLSNASFDTLGEITTHIPVLTLVFAFLLILAIVKIYQDNNRRLPMVYTLFLYLFFGFWILTLAFQGPIWSYYYMPFIPILIIIFCSLIDKIPKSVFMTLFILIYLASLNSNLTDLATYNHNPRKQDVSTWKFNALVAEEVFKEAQTKKEFGYFIFTPDLYGYPPRYAMDFYSRRLQDSKEVYQRKNPEVSVYPYDKKELTFLLIAPPPDYGKDPNSLWYKKNINSTIWRSNDVKISKDPTDKIVFDNSFVIEKYELLPEEIQVKANPYLIQSIFFR